MPHPRLSLKAFTCLGLATLMLAGCGLFPDHKPKPRTPALSKSALAEQFVYNVSMSQMALRKDVSATPYVQKLNELGKKNKTPESLDVTIVVLNYNTSDTIVIAPLGNGKSKFVSLQKIQKQAGGGQLKDIQVYGSEVSVPPPFKFSKDDKATLTEQIASEQQKLLANKHALSSVDAAQAQLLLTKYFLETKQRDAAYLALEDAKYSLAYIAEKNPEKDIASLSKETDALEDRLHKEMPYNL